VLHLTAYVSRSENDELTRLLNPTLRYIYAFFVIKTHNHTRVYVRVYVAMYMRAYVIALSDRLRSPQWRKQRLRLLPRYAFSPWNFRAPQHLTMDDR